MNKYVRLILLLTLVVATALVAYKFSYFISEKYFFDEILYRKSKIHGYKYDPNNYRMVKSKDIKKRIEDVLLLTQNRETSNKVLGLTSEREYKIVVLGDSFVYGYGIRRQDRFSEILEELLNQHHPTKVYALGLGGDGILDNLAKYKLAQTQINPDLVIYALVNNDFSIDGTNRYPNEEALYYDLLKRCPGETFMFNWTKDALSWPWDKLFLTAMFPAATEKYNNACIFSKAISAMDIESIIFFPMNAIPKDDVTLPSTFDDIASESFWKHEWIMRKFKNIIEAQGGFIIDYDYSDIPDNLLRVSKLEGHFSAFTNRRIAEMLYQEILSNPRWMFLKDE